MNRIMKFTGCRHGAREEEIVTRCEEPDQRRWREISINPSPAVIMGRGLQKSLGRLGASTSRCS
jgi:hypothetical protein